MTDSLLVCRQIQHIIQLIRFIVKSQIKTSMQTTKKSAASSPHDPHRHTPSFSRKGPTRPPTITRKGPGSTEAQRRAHSSHQLRLLKTQDNFTADLAFTNEGRQKLEKTALFTGTALRFMKLQATPLRNKKNVFGRFSQGERDYVSECISLVKSTLSENNLLSNGPEQAIWQVELYLSSLEDNNAKLLEVNYFFKKEFNVMMAQQSTNKSTPKCSREYCLECRYHIEKENKWKQERGELQREVERLRRGVSVRGSKVRSNGSGQGRGGTRLELQLRKEVEELQAELEVKDEEYMVLLKEFNYLDDLNRELKNKVAVTLEEYRYLSIQNRTLLGIKAQLSQRENECKRLKEERNTFKRKLITLHRQHTQMIEEQEEEEQERRGRASLMVRGGRGAIPLSHSPVSRRGPSPSSQSNSPHRGHLPQEESLFSLSSLSTENNRSIGHSSPI